MTRDPAHVVRVRLGGNDHSRDDGSVSSGYACSHASPPFAEYQISLGSVPTHTRSACAGLAAIDMMRRPSRPTRRHDAPPSSLRYAPPRSVPHHARPRTSGSAARQVGRSPRPADDVTVPRSASIAITVLSVATRIEVMPQALSSAVAKQAQEARGVEPLVLVAK